MLWVGLGPPLYMVQFLSMWRTYQSSSSYKSMYNPLTFVSFLHSAIVNHSFASYSHSFQFSCFLPFNVLNWFKFSHAPNHQFHQITVERGTFVSHEQIKLFTSIFNSLVFFFITKMMYFQSNYYFKLNFRKYSSIIHLTLMITIVNFIQMSWPVWIWTKRAHKVKFSIKILYKTKILTKVLWPIGHLMII